jgi:hypothetical protein
MTITERANIAMSGRYGEPAGVDKGSNGMHGSAVKCGCVPLRLFEIRSGIAEKEGDKDFVTYRICNGPIDYVRECAAVDGLCRFRILLALLLVGPTTVGAAELRSREETKRVLRKRVQLPRRFHGGGSISALYLIV